jgi:kexin
MIKTKVKISYFLLLLLLSISFLGCGGSSNNNNNNTGKNVELQNYVAVYKKPDVKSEDIFETKLSYTNKNTLEVVLNGEVGSKVYVNGIQEGVIDSNGKAKLRLTTGLNDGVKTYYIKLKDYNNNETKVLEYKIKKDTTPPKISSLDFITVPENKKDVFTIKATDLNGKVTYSLSGLESDKFNVDKNSGKIIFKEAPDYEIKRKYSLNVIATDIAKNRAIQKVTIQIKNIPEIKPKLQSTQLTFDENSLDVEGKVNILEAGDTHIYKMVLFGVDSNLFKISQNGIINPIKELDYETVSSYKFQVVAYNGAGKSKSVDITINVKDIQEGNIWDQDNDFIPNDIEIFLGMNPNNSDENENGIVDGLESEGIHGDQFFTKQWHLKSLGTVVNDSGVKTVVGNDLRIMDIYHRYMGYNNANPIIVQVVDDGVDASHEDLRENMDMSRSYRHTGRTSVGDPTPASTGKTHGTMVSGIIASRAFNGKGVRGVAPFAKIAGSNWLEVQSVSGLEKVWLTGEGANEIAITNNSWGELFVKNSTYENILQKGTENLRDGKGRVYVVAAGNYRYYDGNSNLSYIANNRYVIAVGALTHKNVYASYSNPGGNLLVSAYGGGYYTNSPAIATTINEGNSVNSGSGKNTWSEDLNHNYTYMMGGTSAASPVVSGVIALVMEACPNLSWRDVKYLSATHATRVDAGHVHWVKNSAGLWHSEDYGYGLINPEGMIEECTNNYTNLPQERSFEIYETINMQLEDSSDVVFNIKVDENIKIEWIDLTIDSNHPQASDYRIELISPSGTVSKLVDWSSLNGDWMNGGFKFGAAGFIDEDSKGEWKVRISDFNIQHENLSGTIKSLKLKFYGH